MISFQVQAYEDDFDDNPLYSLSSSDTVTTGNWPVAPTNLAATPVSGTEIDLAWTAACGQSGYVIDSSPDGVTWTQIGTAGVDATSYPDTTVTGEGTTVYYQVQALNGSAGSALSNVASATSLPAADHRPDGKPGRRRRRRSELDQQFQHRDRHRDPGAGQRTVAGGRRCGSQRRQRDRQWHLHRR